MKYFLFIFLMTSFALSRTVFVNRFGGITGLNINNIAIYICFIALLISDFATGRFKEKYIFGLKIIIVATVFLFFSMVYTKINKHPSESYFFTLQLIKRMYVDPFLLYIMAFFLIDSKTDSSRFLIIILVTFSLLNIVSLILMKMGVSFFLVQEYSKTISDRYTGFLGNPNKTSYFLCSLLPFFFYYIINKHGLILKALFSILIVFNVFTIAISGSRGGLVALIMIMFFILILKKKYVLLLIFSVISFLSIIYIVSHNVSITALERIQPLLNGDIQQGTSGRLEIWSALMDVYKSDIITVLLGLGVGGSELVGLKADPHNFYLQVLSEFGIIGFLFFAIAFMWVASNIWIHQRRKSDDYGIYLLASMGAICIGWLFSSLDGIMNFVFLTIGVGVTQLLYLDEPVSDIECL